MTRVIVKWGENCINIPAEEFHEDGEFIKIYNEHCETVGIFKTTIVDCAYRIESDVRK